MSDLLTVILAAGKGTRMKSDLTKVLHPVAGQTMLSHVIKTVDEFAGEIVCVVGHQAKKVKESITADNIHFVEQQEQLGTGHAVKQAEKYIEKHKGPVLILYGDTPLLRSETVSQLVERHQNLEADLTVLTAILTNPTGYGRIVRKENEYVEAVIEEDDAEQSIKEIKEINSGVYCIDSQLLYEFLQNMDTDNAQQEYYLTDIIAYADAKDLISCPMLINDQTEIVGINDRATLAKAEKILRERINLKHMKNGVTIIDPATTYIDADIEIGKDTVIYPFVYLENATQIGENCIIGPHSRLQEARLADDVELLEHSIIRKSSIGTNTIVGPFAYLRPGCNIGENCKVGDFVELKKAQVGNGAKVPHLSYVGDAEIGENTNIGAGTIFANYDGVNKHRTSIGNNVFIGSNTVLVAPVKIGLEAKTGAGSVVTKDVSPGETVVGVPAHKYSKEKN